MLTSSNSSLDPLTQGQCTETHERYDGFLTNDHKSFQGWRMGSNATDSNR